MKLLNALRDAKVVKVISDPFATPEEKIIAYWGEGHAVVVVDGNGDTIDIYSRGDLSKESLSPEEALVEVEEVALTVLAERRAQAYQEAWDARDLDWLLSYIENDLNHPDAVDAIFEMFKPDELY